MEGDSIRVRGGDTLVDIWIGGKMRSISVSFEAIGAFLGFEKAAGISDDGRCEFVRTHLPLIVEAATVKLDELGPAADAISIESGELPRPDGAVGDRRRTERRKGERRVNDRGRPGGLPERRRGDRRSGARRRTTRPR